MRKPCKQQAFVKLQIHTTFRKTKNNDSGASKVGFFFFTFIHSWRLYKKKNEIFSKCTWISKKTSVVITGRGTWWRMLNIVIYDYTCPSFFFFMVVKTYKFHVIWFRFHAILLLETMFYSSSTSSNRYSTRSYIFF